MMSDKFKVEREKECRLLGKHRALPGHLLVEKLTHSLKVSKCPPAVADYFFPLLYTDECVIKAYEF